mmetsp:Transcript_10609/g.31605  ORF Transcript_10609/g.31605 Transcript_10609/m.31605 type:complete len:219 (-) Transcript_10609:33-689(-)
MRARGHHLRAQRARRLHPRADGQRLHGAAPRLLPGSPQGGGGAARAGHVGSARARHGQALCHGAAPRRRHRLRLRGAVPPRRHGGPQQRGPLGQHAARGRAGDERGDRGAAAARGRAPAPARRVQRAHPRAPRRGTAPRHVRRQPPPQGARAAAERVGRGPGAGAARAGAGLRAAHARHGPPRVSPGPALPRAAAPLSVLGDHLRPGGGERRLRRGRE